MLCILTPDIFLTCRVEPGTDYKNGPKFIVFYTALLNIFSMFCFMCKADSPRVSMKKNGTMVTVKQHCKNCPTGYTWKSQPLVMQTYPAGNMLLSFAISAKYCSFLSILVCRLMKQEHFFITRLNLSFLPYFTTGDDIGWH